jgi:hypothetical protein
MGSSLKRFRSWIIGAAAGFTLVGGLALASTWFNYFGPVTGILYGDSSSPQTRAAAAGDVESLWTGTCSSTTYLRGDGECATPPGTGGGTVNSVGLSMPSGFAVANSPVTNSATLAVTTTLSGPLLGTGSGFSTAAASDIVGLFTSCSGTEYLGADGACHSAGAGTVTSVGLSTPSVFSVGSSPVTGAGTLALTFATGQTANEFLATPDGSSGAIGLRAIASDDIPTSLPALTSASTLATVGTIGAGTWQGAAVGAAYGGSGEAGTITGILKANGSSPFTAALYGDVTGLWSGTCSSSTYLRGDGQCVTPTGGAGSVTSVSLADGSTSAIYAISGSPVTTSGTLTETLKTQSANTIFAGPSSGSAAQPNFRAMVAADLPANGANPSASVGLTAVNGSASTWMRSDAAPALSQSIAPTMTGAWRFNSTLTLEDSSGGGPFNVGYLGAPLNDQGNSSYTLTLSDRGKAVYYHGAGGETITIPPSVFSGGDTVTIFDIAGTITIAAGAGVTLGWCNGTAATGTRTMTAQSVATILFATATFACITGSGVS